MFMRKKRGMKDFYESKLSVQSDLKRLTDFIHCKSYKSL